MGVTELNVTVSDASISYQVGMDVRSSGLVHSAESDIERLQQILRESYASGFTIFKELLQNAEDAGAKRLIVVGHNGFPEASNPLLQTPGLIVANDGGVFARNMDGITRASGGSKADERAAVGRFGLGQKSVYHLCDAFIALGRVEDEGGRPRLLIMNPWEKVSEADVAATAWPSLTTADAEMLLGKVAEIGLDKGMALFLPLRTANLRPGYDLCLSDQNWEPDSAIADILQGAELPAALSCLRSLQSIEVRPTVGEGRRLSLRKGARRLSGPGIDQGDPIVAGQIDGAGFTLEFNGRQQWMPGGKAAKLLDEDGWDKVFDIHRKLIPPKANPHGAVLVCRSSAKAGEAVLRVRDAVYLPLGQPVESTLIGHGSHDIDLLIHGYFFVSSDRRKLRDDDHIESDWNEALRREASLPLMLDALADSLPAMPGEQERQALVRAVQNSAWWSENRVDVCQGRGMAWCWPGEKAESWQVCASASLRPIPGRDSTTLSRLKSAFPSLEDWCTAKGIGLAFGTVLADIDPQWPDAELAELLEMAGPAAFTKGPVAETLSVLLDASPPGLSSRAALADAYRRAALDVSQNFANAEKLKPLVRHLPLDNVLVLPSSVDNRELIAALVSSGPTLPVKAGWAAGEGADLRRLGLDEASDLLFAIEPFLGGRGEAAHQASALISHLLRNGPSLAEFAAHAHTRNLRVIPVRRMQDDFDERLSLGEIASITHKGLLFDAAPNSELSVLAGAIAQPYVYRVGLRDGGIADLASAKKLDCLLGVLRQATRFADPAKCGELAEMLRDHATRDDLRQLVAGEPGLRQDVELIELDQFDGALDELVTALREGRRDRLVSSVLAAELKKAVREKVGLCRVDMSSLGEWLQEAYDAERLPEWDAATAIALLKSGIAPEILKVLPLHGCEDDDELYAADQLFIGRKTDITSRLVPFARLADLWPDPGVNRIQNQLIARWGAEASIKTALNTPNPAQFTDEICAALAELKTLDEELAELLRSISWIAAKNAVWRPDQVLDLPIEVEKSFTGQDAFLMSGEIPGCLREDRVREPLRKVMPDRMESYRLGFRHAGERGIIGLCLDVSDGLEELRQLARKKADVEIDCWPLLAAALRDDLPDETIIQLARNFHLPDKAAIISQMNAIAGLALSGAVGEAAKRLHRTAYSQNLRTLRSNGTYLPSSLLLPSAIGEFRSADTLALNAEGIFSAALLVRDYAEQLNLADLEQPPSLEAVSGKQPDLLDGIERAFSPIGQHDVGDGILLALAMLGRDEPIRALASKWEGQRSFDRICDDLDALADQQRDMCGANRERFAELRFAIEFPKDGQVRVRSAAGSDCIVPLSGRGEALLLDCSQRGIERDEAGYRHVFDLVFGPVAPTDEGEAKELLDQLVRKLGIALMLGFERHKEALSDLLHSYFASDQRTLDDTCAELKDVLHDRLEGIKPGPVMREALKAYHRDVHRGRDNAREALWQAARSDSGAHELLAATRKKVGEMGYEPHRVLFELYQNAIDAQAQWHSDGRFRVEVVRDADLAISRLRVVHWGRPINQPGADPHKAEEEGHRRDLSNMLAISHSAKEGDGVTGRFGLGFKTVHMLADEIRLASGGIAIRILGGMIPAEWPDGGREIAPFNDRGRKATLIEIPITGDRNEDAAAAWEAFRRAAELLAALGRESSIELVDEKQDHSFRHVEHELIEGVSFLEMDGGRHLLKFALSDGFRLFLPFGPNGPHAFLEDVSQFWHLVPLVGERRRGAWLMEGRFPVNPGRTEFSDQPEEKERLFSRLGFKLGERLVAFYDYCLTDWDKFSEEAALDPEGREDFWRKVVNLFADDLTRFGPEQALHNPACGLARLLAQRPLVPLAFGGAVCAANVKWRLDGALAKSAVRDRIGRWSAIEAMEHGLIEESTADLLARLDLSRGQRLTLSDLVDTIVSGEGVDAALADILVSLLDDDVRNVLTGEEDKELRQIFRDRKWLAEDGTWQSVRLLAFPQSDDTAERARAAFAPPSGRLSQSYSADGFKLAEFAREQAGSQEPEWQRWAEGADSSDLRKAALIRYLVDADQRTVSLLSQAAAWLPPASELAQSAMLDSLSPDERGRLLAKLGLYFGATPIGPAPEPAFQPDAEAALLGIADWWRENRGALVPAYDRAVYPEDFSISALGDGDEATWFTLLALASFQTLGRIRPFQSRQFVADAMQDGWWRTLATIEPDDAELRPFVERLRAWSEPDAEEGYLIWRRCLTDLCMISRHLDAYRRLFMRFPAIVAQEGDQSLRNHLRPSFSHVAARMGLEAAPLARSLGIGANWLIRELARNGGYSQDQAELVAPYGWSTAAKVRRLMHSLGVGHFDHGVDQGRLLHQTIQRLIGDEARFNGDGDLPLHIVTLAKHRSELDAILWESNGSEWGRAEWDDEENDDDDA